MNTTEALNKAESLLKSVTVSSEQPQTNRLDIDIKTENLQKAIKVLIDNEWGYLSAIIGVDRPEKPAEGEEPTPETKGDIEILYPFCEGEAIVSLRIRVPYDNPVVDTVCTLIPSATLYEREMIEMFGIEIKDTPDTNKLLLPDDWPEGQYPLRKSFKGLGK